MGNKHRPFYRIVVTKSTAGRNGAFIENIGTYNPLTKPSTVTLENERALHWLMEGAQPTETVAFLLKREGVLGQFFAARPKAEASYKFLDKSTALMSKKSVATVAEAAPAKVEAPVAEAPVAEEPIEPVVEETPAETPTEESAPAEEGQ